ncbi:TetR family transcriptional regulator [Microbacterium sp. PI-1]|nr:MAG: TetR family transcriptional regulator [Actinobacteria bacterium HGW-Actinobacteria-11]QEA28718.1 TetR family transcriptional regulator [Microbacterium sp. CBA3102]TCJ28261.1 TetR family transcriptional regulator [Microbacterium sp. PI-1]
MPVMLVTNMTGMARTSASAERLRASALRLFSEHGFDDVTVEQIARDVGVSHMTFFRHFPTKEDAILDDPYDPFIAEAVAAQPADLPSVERVRRGLLRAWDSVPAATPEETRTRVTIIAGHPRLRARAWQNTQQTESLIVEALTAQGTPRREAVVAAGACLGAVMAALLEWGSEASDAPLGPTIVDALGLLATGAKP